ncbi:MAG: hypothetical protein ABI416_02170 [Ginsengibacter sp.]
MKSMKLKAIFLGLSLCAFSATFAQDTTGTPKTDTTKLPKHDSTSMVIPHSNGNLLSFQANVSNALLVSNVNKAEAKIEAIKDEKFFKATYA